jgi:hypothetical protein
VSTQQTVTLYATADNTLIYSTTNPAAANTAYSAGDISVGCNWLDGLYFDDWVCGATALKFNTTTLSGKTILSAYLRLDPYILPADTFTQYKAYAYAASWSPSTLTFNNEPNIYTSYTVLANPPTNTVLPVEWNVTNIVKQWASGAWVNNGIAIHDNDYTFPGYTAYRATSFESTNTTSGSDRPRLVVTYQ